MDKREELEENGFMDWWDKIDDIEREEYNQYREEIESFES